MKRIVFALALILTVVGCQAPQAIRRSLDVQARYTRIYVEATLPLLRTSSLPQREELEGIGARLVRNADALKAWADNDPNSQEVPDKPPKLERNDAEKNPEVPESAYYLLEKSRNSRFGHLRPKPHAIRPPDRAARAKIWAGLYTSPNPALPLGTWKGNVEKESVCLSCRTTADNPQTGSPAGRWTERQIFCGNSLSMKGICHEPA